MIRPISTFAVTRIERIEAWQVLLRAPTGARV
jgi:hypothetical protein